MVYTDTHVPEQDSFAAFPLTHSPAPHVYPGFKVSCPEGVEKAQKQLAQVFAKPQPETDEKPQVTVTEVELPYTDKRAWTVDGLFSAEECKLLMQLSEAQGYQAAMVNVDGDKQRLIPEVRNNYRTVVSDEDLAVNLYSRVAPYVPNKMNDCDAVGLNEQIRFLRYDAGQAFYAHHDGSYERPDGPKKGERSYLTFQLYLNEGFEGGSTRFLQDNKVDGVDVHPKLGRVLLFEHDMLHQGSPPAGNMRKYAIRTDVMFRPTA